MQLVTICQSRFQGFGTIPPMGTWPTLRASPPWLAAPCLGVGPLTLLACASLMAQLRVACPWQKHWQP